MRTMSLSGSPFPKGKNARSDLQQGGGKRSRTPSDEDISSREPQTDPHPYSVGAISDQNQSKGGRIRHRGKGLSEEVVAGGGNGCQRGWGKRKVTVTFDLELVKTAKKSFGVPHMSGQTEKWETGWGGGNGGVGEEAKGQDFSVNSIEPKTRKRLACNQRGRGGGGWGGAKKRPGETGPNIGERSTSTEKSRTK